MTDVTDIIEKQSQWPSMSDDERELAAVEARATIGIVPYRLWTLLSIESRLRLASLSQSDASKRLAETAKLRDIKSEIEEAAIADMLRGGEHE